MVNTQRKWVGVYLFLMLVCCWLEENIGTNCFTFYSILFLFHCSLIQRLDGKSKDISKIAADITQNVSLRQGMERKKVIQHIRGLYKTDLSASRHWQELVQQLTHDRWASKFLCPKSLCNIGTECSNKIIMMMIDNCFKENVSLMQNSWVIICLNRFK